MRRLVVLSIAGALAAFAVGARPATPAACHYRVERGVTKTHGRLAACLGSYRAALLWTLAHPDPGAVWMVWRAGEAIAAVSTP